jgi:hypothetical protein
MEIAGVIGHERLCSDYELVARVPAKAAVQKYITTDGDGRRFIFCRKRNIEQVNDGTKN